MPADSLPALDRAHIRRRDGQWVRERLADPDALVILVTDSRILVSGDHPPHPLLPRWGEVCDHGLDLEPPILLGLHHGATILAAGVVREPDMGDPPVLHRGMWADLRALGWLFDTWEGDAACLAKAMVHWHRRARFCGECGSVTKDRDGGFARVCTGPACGREQFPRTDPAVIVLVSGNDHVLLARQAAWVRGRYSAVAGFVEPAESLERAVIREVREETGLRVRDVRYRFSQAWPFPGTIMTAFRASADTEEIVRDDGELEDARWFSRADIEEGLASGGLSLPPPFAAGFRLVEEWCDEGGGRLRDLVRRRASVG